jgi:hypothetical protein
VQPEAQRTGKDGKEGAAIMAVRKLLQAHAAHVVRDVDHISGADAWQLNLDGSGGGILTEESSPQNVVASYQGDGGGGGGGGLSRTRGNGNSAAYAAVWRERPPNQGPEEEGEVPTKTGTTDSSSRTLAASPQRGRPTSGSAQGRIW